ncbi:MAG: hypothetical protein KJO05_00945 [Bacteroidia bacterium]|nr:hypothetical protein [Bacteroidia bacterium]NNF32103.1 hypothetical protein [Flavobacteriaceae bacterium]MBT8275142.1 hypothetical protein [Bacteroidia bacterium]NNJ82247.1 hypothetical protein [Flavobacteriaceae bacterium]NNK54967.1 hypothetical protein [Flavobacteriaceae bacterium]
MNLSPKKHANGCLWLVVMAIVLTVSFGVITVSLDLPILLSLVLSVTGSVFIALKLVGRPKLSSLIGGAVIAIIVIGILVAGISFLFSMFEPPVTSTVFEVEESVQKTYRFEDNDSVEVYAANRFWRDNMGNDFNAVLAVRVKDYQKLKNHINGYRPASRINFWGDLYDYIERTDRPALDIILESFSMIQNEKKLNKMEFAEMVVTCIQDIPYSLVFQEDCLDSTNYEYDIRKLLEDCPECCIGNIMYGIQNPVSFMKNLKGDCDTRTVMIYSILKSFGYDVAILNSEYYRHSILGINLPASGKAKVYKGKKYALWETTAKYYSAGSLPATYSDISYWDIVLTSK